jgi:predicted anti-sigma-YlaC factor YlaD
MHDHDRFEALAGALALGEATPQERVVFKNHASECRTCRDDAIGITRVSEIMAAAREHESWRPSIGGALMTRIRDERLRRSRLTLRALGWSVALSIALDAAFVSGVTSYAGRVLRDTGGTMANVVASYRAGVR